MTETRPPRLPGQSPGSDGDRYSNSGDQKLDLAVSLASRAVVCHHFNLQYDATLINNGRHWTGIEHFVRPATRAYHIYLLAPAAAHALRHESVFGTLDFDCEIISNIDAGDLPNNWTKDDELQNEVLDIVRELLPAISVVADGIFQTCDLQAFDHRRCCEANGVVVGGGESLRLDWFLNKVDEEIRDRTAKRPFEHVTDDGTMVAN